MLASRHAKPRRRRDDFDVEAMLVKQNYITKTGISLTMCRNYISV
jgi:hypothetical protein